MELLGKNQGGDRHKLDDLLSEWDNEVVLLGHHA